jgi:excisionase family DNA binding protein
MTTLWSCLNPKCPPTDIAPKEVEEPGEERSDEPDQILTTQDVAELLKVPLNTIYKWNKSGTGPPFYMIGKGIRYRMGHVQRWRAEQDGGLAVCSSQCGRTYPRSAFTQVEGNA